VAVIGGGVSGLAAAHRLLKLVPNVQVRVYEASDRLGGPLHTIRTRDSVLEQGADSFLITKPAALELCRELGLADQLVPTNEHHRRALVVRNGKLLPVPEGFVLMQPRNLRAIWRSPVLSLRGKLRLLAEPLVRRPRAALEPDHDENVASFAIRRLGREAYERLVEPLMAGIFVADAHKLSLAATYPEFLQAEREYGSLRASLRASTSKARGGEDDSSYEIATRPQPAAARYGQFVTLRRGLRSLIDALADALPDDAVQLHASIERVECDRPGRWVIHLGHVQRPAAFDAIVIATSAPQAGRLLAGCDNDLSKQLGSIEYASSAVVTLVYQRDQIDRPLDGFGAVVPSIERRPIIAASFLSVKFPGHVPASQAVVRVFMGGVFHPGMVDRDDADLIAIARQELGVLIGARGKPVGVHVARWRNAMPQYHVAHLKRVQKIEELASRHSGLKLVGSAYRGVGIPQCVHSGRLAAEQLAAELDQRQAVAAAR
jgi:oxygen-dependent protoporphyrinogen oxidase